MFISSTMKRMRPAKSSKWLTIPFLLVVLYTTPLLVVAEPNSQSGDITLEETVKKEASPRASGQRGAAEWIDSLTKGVDGGGAGTVSVPTDAALNYLSVMYLYCISKAGSCGFILDAILETDVLSSRRSGQSECPVMTKFWKAWLQNECEKRAKFLVSTSNAALLADFNRVSRPRYVKCKETVGEVLKESSSKRYVSGSAIGASIKRTDELIQEIKTREIDVFSSVGIVFATKKQEE